MKIKYTEADAEKSIEKVVQETLFSLGIAYLHFLELNEKDIAMYKKEIQENQKIAEYINKNPLWDIEIFESNGIKLDGLSLDLMKIIHGNMQNDRDFFKKNTELFIKQYNDKLENASIVRENYKIFIAVMERKYPLLMKKIREQQQWD